MLARLPPTLRQILKVAFAVLVFVVLVGITYQSVATALERREIERPGRFVDVGGHQLHIHCQGEGSPIVVLEAAAGSMSAAWGWVQPDVARLTRVCSYDRAWLGWSEGGDSGYSAERMVEELHTLLAGAHEPGPFVLVGHELGASVVRDFASRFGSETAAIVLVDEAGAEAESLFVRSWPWLARVGLLRTTGALSNLADGLPRESGDVVRIFLNRPDHLARAALEVLGVDAAEAESVSRVVDASIPVTSITTSSRGRPALLSTSEQAEPVTLAIHQALERWREQADGAEAGAGAEAQ
ncbi:MAG: alpha/beta hydrolase [Acidobacteria bacterium]|nr:alpha/beta hydrolase [Acidobacteriota bacterium]